jgi:hypothetical protein
VFIIYKVQIIENIDQMKHCPIFHINHHQWRQEYQLQAYGQMALQPDYGLIVTMTAMETNPLRRFTEDDSPVYKDSALEAFFTFAPEQPDKGYLNFEMNAYGAMLSEYGVKGNRKKLKEVSPYHAECTVSLDENSWSVVLKVPMELIYDVYGKSLQEGDIFTCNFYKISEDPSIEHYISYSPIDSSVPDFHRPDDFATAVIEFI